MCCGMVVKWMGMSGESVRKKNALPANMKIITLTGKKRQNLTCFVYELILVVKYILLADFNFLGVILDLDKYIFLRHRCFILGIILR